MHCKDPRMVILIQSMFSVGSRMFCCHVSLNEESEQWLRVIYCEVISWPSLNIFVRFVDNLPV